MTRTLKRKLTFFTAISGLLLVGIVVIRTLNIEAYVWIVVLVLLIPGRVQGYYYRNFYRGRGLAGTHQYDAALESFQKFIDELRVKPWLQKLLSLSFSIYTPSIEAMTYNNIGCAYLESGQFAASADAFEMALRIDSEYPLPFYNKAILAAAEEDTESIAVFLNAAKKLGLRKTSVDKILQKAAAINARLQAQTVKPQGD